MSGQGNTPLVVVFGSLNVDLVCRVETIARPGETVLAPGYDQLFGGKGANQAVAAARALGGRVAMVGAVGDDALGRAVTANLAREGIDVAAIQTVPGRTGCAFISIDAAGENAITVASGANGRFTAKALDDERLDARSVLVLQMETPLAENLAAAAKARARGARVVVNLAPVPRQLDAAALEQLLALTDWLVVNETELAAAAHLAGLAAGSSAEQAGALAERHGIVVIATLGAEGAVVADPVASLQRIAAHKVSVVDTTGAGDTFVGVLAAGLATGLAVPQAASRAVIAGSLACRKIGAQSAMPTGAEIDATER
ncbi:ribokinase [Aurantimonas aggregata]|uniref:ribokinase n=1 Tax=Aurantimonas aggregata TaxID=2047720 RepID=UPI001FE24A32|nr:ribokinase [Aurantimonas aggregata]